MGQLTVTKEQRGTALKLIISILRVANDYTDMSTGNIPFGDFAQIRGTVKVNKSHFLKLCIGMKKFEVAKNLVVKIKITYDKSTKQTTCTNEWVEVIMDKTIPAYAWVLENNNKTAYTYTAVVNVTVQTESLLTSYINNQLYEDTEFTDFQLRSPDGTVPVHKALLAIHSDTFKAMLGKTWKETEENSFNIDGATLQTLQHLKEYMYLGTLPDEGLEALLIIASRYFMEKLETDCVTKLIETLKPENFDGLIELACHNNIPKLMRAALVLGIPDEIVNGVHQLKINEKKTEDTDSEDKE